MKIACSCFVIILLSLELPLGSPFDFTGISNLQQLLVQSSRQYHTPNKPVSKPTDSTKLKKPVYVKTPETKQEAIEYSKDSSNIPLHPLKPIRDYHHTSFGTENDNHETKLSTTSSFILEGGDIRSEQREPISESLSSVSVIGSEDKLQNIDIEEPNYVDELNKRIAAEEKSAILTFAPGLIPVVASIGATLAFGGLAYYMYPLPSSEDMTGRADLLNFESFDRGAKVVHQSELTEREKNRIKGAHAYRVSARNVEERKPHPYGNLLVRLYNAVVPESMAMSVPVPQDNTRRVKVAKNKKSDQSFRSSEHESISPLQQGSPEHLPEGAVGFWSPEPLPVSQEGTGVAYWSNEPMPVVPHADGQSPHAVSFVPHGPQAVRKPSPPVFHGAAPQFGSIPSIPQRSHGPVSHMSIQPPAGQLVASQVQHPYNFVQSK